MTEEIAERGWEKVSDFRVGLIRVRELFDERHVDEVAHRLVPALHSVGQRVEKGRKVIAAIGEEGFRPSLNIGHERVWKNLTFVVFKVLRESRQQVAEPPHQGTDEGDGEWLAHGA